MRFSSKKEKIIQKSFLKKGYIIFNVENKKVLKEIKNRVENIAINFLKKHKIRHKKKNLLDTIHLYIKPKNLNEFRLFVYSKINNSRRFQEMYYNLAKKHLDMICGNELVMQKKCNLSIQLPKDKSSLLPLHADVWVGDSEYEVVFWLPLVHVYKTKSMYILPKVDNDKYSKKIKYCKSVEDIFKKVKNKAKWLKLDFGQGLLFTQNLMHGNIVNIEKGTRWSFNSRFKAVFSPYRDKEIGTFFRPITLKPVTLLGMNFNLPDAKK